MKKRRFKEKHRSPISGIQKKENIHKPVVKRKQKFNIFKKDKPFRGKKKIKRRNRNIGITILVVILILIVLGLIFISVKYVLSSRGRNTEDTKQTYVLGLEEIPAYPSSEFLFEKNKDTDTVQNFLMNGESAYTLPGGITREDVNEYYLEKLPNIGWTNVLSVAIGSDDKKYGEYWIKNGKGLRIYVKETSIWYETISQQEAQTGLADEVADEIERELLLASSETQDLLPDFPWVLAVPKEYLITYASTDIEDLRSVSFKKIGTSFIYSITPVGYYNDDTYDGFLYKYIDSKNTTDTEEWGVQNSYYTTKGGRNVLMADIVSPDGLISGAVVYNSFDGAVYVFLSSTEEDDTFFEYILKNIQPLESHN
jgi:hypothetical protein